MDMHRAYQLRRRIRIALSVVVFGLVFSGLSVFPILLETYWLEQWFGATAGNEKNASAMAMFISHIREGVVYMHQHYNFIFYGLDWLGFAHFAIALAFIAPYRDPVNHSWTIWWGVLVCVLCIPAVFIFGWMRHMPLLWSLMDSLFPLGAAVPLVLAGLWTRELALREEGAVSQGGIVG